MASLSFDKKREGWRLLFNDSRENGHKSSIWLGKLEESTAREIKQHVEHLLFTATNRRPPCLATSEWLESIDQKLRSKLAKKGFCESLQQQVSRRITLAKWIEEYITDRSDKKPSTINTYEQAKESLLAFFGRKKLLRDLTRRDAAKWRDWMKKFGNRRNKNTTKLSEDTVRRRTGIAKQFINEAIRIGLLAENPFSDIPSNMRGNKERQQFINSSVIEQCMEHCPSIEWRTILALARYAGIRIPSELVSLEWANIDLPGGKMLIKSPKTEDHPNGESRWCPIFPELRPYLEEASWDAAREGEQFVVPSCRSKSKNLRQGFLRILNKAGISPWPKIFHNLRASRETELLRKFPLKDVCSWIGNSERVALKSYAMPTDESFVHATKEAASISTADSSQKGYELTSERDCGCHSGCLRSISGVISDDGEIQENPTFPEKSEVLLIADSAGKHYLIGRAGLEPATKGL